MKTKLITKIIPVAIMLWLMMGTDVARAAESIVTAPEAPFEFTPLTMFDFPKRDFSIVKYGAKQNNVTATTAAFAKAMAACNVVVTGDKNGATGDAYTEALMKLL